MPPGNLQGVSDQDLISMANGGSTARRPAPSAPPADPRSDRDLINEWYNGRQMGGLEDAGRSLVTGLERGVTQTLGIPRALSTASDTAGDWLTNQALHAAGRPSLTPQQIQQVHAVTHAVQGASPFGIINPNMPSTGEMDQQVQNVAGPYHTPQSSGGRLALTAGEMAPGAAMPGGLAERAGRVILPAVGAWGGGEVTRGTPFEPWARLGGGLAGGVAEGGFEALNAGPGRVMANATQGLTEDQIAQATALRESAAQQGIDLTVPEAVQQVTNGATGLGRVQRLVENTNRTAPDMAAYFAQRPDQVRSGVMNFTDLIAPPGGDPGMVALDAQRAAQGAQMSANSVRSALASPYYTAADAESVDPDAMDKLLGNLQTNIAADKTGLVAPQLQKLQASLTDANGEPILDQANLSTARNYWRNQIDLPPVSPNSVDKYTAGIIGNHLDDLDALLKANPNRVAGDAAYAGASRNIVDPLNTGPVGAIATAEQVGPQTAALYPQNPPLGQPQATANALEALGAQNSAVGPQLTRQYVGNTFNQATRDLTGGPNQYGGALFARNIAGNAEQGATLRAGFDTLDPSGDLGSKWDDLVDALQATGRRERPGSMTAFNESDLNALKQAPAVIKGIGALGDPLEWTKNFANWTGNQLYGRNLDVLSSMMTDPDTASILKQAISGNQGLPPLAQIAVPAIVSQQGANQ